MVELAYLIKLARVEVARCLGRLAEVTMLRATRYALRVRTRSMPVASCSSFWLCVPATRDTSCLPTLLDAVRAIFDVGAKKYVLVHVGTRGVIAPVQQLLTQISLAKFQRPQQAQRSDGLTSPLNQGVAVLVNNASPLAAARNRIFWAYFRENALRCIGAVFVHKGGFYRHIQAGQVLL